jgi:asparagine synthase (glutamine-hydrolysing)
MCGICGIIHSDASNPVDENLLKRMSSTLGHRGPDDVGYFFDRNAGLGHRRLSIIDLEGGQQPIFNEDRSAAIVFNGEIYNYLDLRENLITRGHIFKTRSDTETIIHAYEEYGDTFVERLRGMFAFAIWDRRLRRLVLARDRLGLKPVYYWEEKGIFAFASEIKALLQIPDIRREVDPEALDLYLSLRYVPGPRTMFKGILKLQPGHVLVLDPAGIHIRRYWDIGMGAETNGDDAERLRDFEQLLEESVRLRLMSEVPLGVFLSGGIDSSAILALMRKLGKGEPPRSFSIGYEAATREEQESNELPYARQAAHAFEAQHHEFQLDSTEFGNAIPKIVWHLDEPLADPSCISLYFLSKLAREHITVVLSGEGADEILAGYTIYRKMLAIEGLNRRFPSLAWLAGRLAPFAPEPRLRNYMSLAGLAIENRYTGVARGLSPGAKAKLLPGSDDSLLHALFASYSQKHAASPLDRMLYQDLKIWLPDNLLMKADKMTMATGLELRVPFLDHRLVEFAFTLPQTLKIQNGQGKLLLRRAMADVLPENILTRPKQGFPVPTEFWLRSQLRDLVRDSLLGQDSACRQFFSLPALKEIIAENEAKVAWRHQDIWTLLVFEFWYRIFIRGHASPEDVGEMVSGRRGEKP